MKKLVVLILILLVVSVFTACEEKPHEECMTDWDYKLEERSKLFISYTAYILTTEYGDVDVTKNIYESAQADEYSTICVMVIPDGPVQFISGTFKDGTPIDQSVIEEIADQIIPGNIEGLPEE